MDTSELDDLIREIGQRNPSLSSIPTQPKPVERSSSSSSSGSFTKSPSGGSGSSGSSANPRWTTEMDDLLDSLSSSGFGPKAPTNNQPTSTSFTESPRPSSVKYPPGSTQSSAPRPYSTNLSRNPSTSSNTPASAPSTTYQRSPSVTYQNRQVAEQRSNDDTPSSPAFPTSPSSPPIVRSESSSSNDAPSPRPVSTNRPYASQTFQQPPRQHVVVTQTASFSTDEVFPGLSAEESSVAQEINKVRSNPSSYISLLQSRLSNLKGNILELWDLGVMIETREGATAINEAINFLRNTDPLPRFQLSSGMSAAAKEAVQETGGKGALTSCQSVDLLNFHGTFERESVEIVSFGNFPAQEMVLRFVIGDGNAQRVHRRHIFNPDYKFMGVAVGEHASQYKKMACVNFTPMFHEK
eukprot:TRINITY_DN144_c0_g2_i1.p1 TRINITY_DN144_c0_g2~~TRINITY_DN144_c0_g2_i1.p1  ORF type:complete len:410 (-),score=89.03 TRINITY_DN144_c0_g2_i1:21-1250(-)